MLKRPFYIATVIGVVLFSLIYFGLDTKPRKQKALEKSRVVNLEATGVQNIIQDARNTLTKEQSSYLDALIDEVKTASDTTSKLKALMRLSKQWYDVGYPILSGYYAEEIGKLEKSKDAWSMAGTTYVLGMRSAKDENKRLFARSRAIQSIERAISIDPESVSDRINLALIYVEAPDQNPMQGILMLKELNEKYPNNVMVLNQLGRLAIQTNQVEKALSRLTKALSIDPENAKTICLLATAYQMAGDTQKASAYQEKCKRIINK